MSARKQTKIWKTKDGRKIRICDMTDRHLINTIKMLEQIAQAKHVQALFNVMRAQNVVGGDGALLALESEERILSDEGAWVRFLPSIYENLIIEHRRRGYTTR